MKKSNFDFAQQWLRKAENDLISGRQILTLECGPTDTPSFHAQQAVEKALKALLTAKGVTFSKVHDLMPLLDQAEVLLPALGSFREIMSELSSYAVEARYPMDEFEPTREDAVSAIEAATSIFSMIQDYINKLEIL